MSTLILLSIIFAASYFAYRYLPTGKYATIRFPPGPKPLPVIGNLRDLPPSGIPEYQHWLAHKDLYGPVSSLSVFGQRLVIIHGRKALFDIMEKNSQNTSGRPKTEFGFGLSGFGSFLNTQQNDGILRRYRKLVHQQIGTPALTAQFDDIQDVEVLRFLVQVLNQPQNLTKHLRMLAGASILRVAYGYSIELRKEDPLVNIITQMVDNFSLAFTPGAWMIDLIPALKYIPDWCPGAEFKKIGRRMRLINKAVAEIPYSFTRKQMEQGIHSPCYVSKLVEACTEEATGEIYLSHDDEHAIKWTAATLYAGGSDTTVRSITSFILAMIMFPEVQRKAQSEIDQIVGTDRLPRFEDRVNLPYIGAVIKEMARWSPVTPMGVPHTVDEDVVYEGYVIPKNALLIPAVWWITHDPEIYANPNQFDPGRYLLPRCEPEALEVFGFGRRKCVGRHFANASMFITVTRILAAFNIVKAIDEHGQEMEVQHKISPGIIGGLLDFPFHIVPRSPKMVELMRAAEAELVGATSTADFLEMDLVSGL